MKIILVSFLDNLTGRENFRGFYTATGDCAPGDVCRVTDPEAGFLVGEIIGIAPISGRMISLAREQNPLRCPLVSAIGEVNLADTVELLSAPFPDDPEAQERRDEL